MQEAPSAALAITTKTELHRLKLDGTAFSEPELVDVVPCGIGVAMGVVGA